MFKTVNRGLRPVKSALIWRWRWGFKGTSRTFFDLAHGADGNYRDYLPDAAFRPMALTNDQHARDVLSSKLLFERVLGAFVPVPENTALITRGEVRAVTPEAAVRDAEGLLEYAREHPLVLKPVSGSKGKGW